MIKTLPFETMSFMYESMMTRAPGKRKIKLQQDNLLRLMQEDDDDDEEDDDFEVSKEQQNLFDDSDDISEDSCSSSSTDSSSSADSSQGISPIKSSSKKSKYRGDSKPQFSPPTIQSTNVQVKSQQYGVSSASLDILFKAKRQFEISSANVEKTLDSIHAIEICCICLKKNKQNEILTCSKCRISLHSGCYGDVRSKLTNGSGQWFCSKCLCNYSPDCEFCPSSEGCIKETTTGQWCHVVCARYILGKDSVDKDLICTTSLDYKRFGLRECTLCEDRIVTKSGIAIKCDAGFCRSFFHVTCAQKYGLLSENDVDQNFDTDPYFVYCPLHVEKEKMAKWQKRYIAAHAIARRRSGISAYDETVLRQKKSAYFNTQRLRFPPLPASGEPAPRLLTSNASAARILNRKAEMMFGINVRNPSSYFPKPSDVRKRQHVTPALTGEFVSHYVDRELRLAEVDDRIRNLITENDKMTEEQKELERKYELLQSKLTTSETEGKAVKLEVGNLLRLCARLKAWSRDQQHVSNQKFKFNPMKPDAETLKKTPEKQSTLKRRLSAEDAKSNDPTSGKNLKFTAKTPLASPSNSLLGRCSVCKSAKRQHLLIDCDVCKRWLHLACLDPPLSHMPKKNKFSLWQCSECALSSGDDSDDGELSRGSLITSEGRRQTRRSRKPPEKLSSSLLYGRRSIKKVKSEYDRMRLMIEKGRIIDTRRRPYQKKNNSNSGILSKIAQEIEKKDATMKATVCEGQVASSSRLLLIKDRKASDSVLAGPPKQARRPVGKLLVGIKPTKYQPIASKSSFKEFKGFKNVINKPVDEEKMKIPQPFTKFQLQHNIPLILASAVVPRKTSKVADDQGKEIVSKNTSPSSASPKRPNSTPQRNTNVVGKKEKSLKSPSVKRQKKADANEDECALKKVKCEHATNVANHASSVKAPLPVCVVCSSSSDEEKMMFCSACMKHYHIWCCDPPLASRPRMTKFFKWLCSNCHFEKKEEEEKVVDVTGTETTPDGRRKITRTRKPPEKFANIFYSSAQQKLMKAVLCRRRVSQTRMAAEKVESGAIDNTDSSQVPQQKPDLTSAGGVTSPSDITPAGGVTSTSDITPVGGITSAGGVASTAGVTLAGAFTLPSDITPVGGITSAGGVVLTVGATSSGGVTSSVGVTSLSDITPVGGITSADGVALTAGVTLAGAVTSPSDITPVGGITSAGVVASTVGVTLADGVTSSDITPVGGVASAGGVVSTVGVTSSGGVALVAVGVTSSVSVTPLNDITPVGGITSAGGVASTAGVTLAGAVTTPSDITSVGGITSAGGVASTFGVTSSDITPGNSVAFAGGITSADSVTLPSDISPEGGAASASGAASTGGVTSSDITPEGGVASAVDVTSSGNTTSVIEVTSTDNATCLPVFSLASNGKPTIHSFTTSVSPVISIPLTTISKEWQPTQTHSCAIARNANNVEAEDKADAMQTSHSDATEPDSSTKNLITVVFPKPTAVKKSPSKSSFVEREESDGTSVKDSKVEADRMLVPTAISDLSEYEE